MQGTVKWYDSKKSFGFITCDDNKEVVLVRYKDIQMDGFRDLKEDQRVEFDVVQGANGPQAISVRPL